MGLAVALICLVSYGSVEGTPDVSGSPIPNSPLAGNVNGVPFRITLARMDADGKSSMSAQGLGEDSVRPYKLRLQDRRGFGDLREISLRIQVDWDRRLDGKTIRWRPYPDESPEDRKQKTMDTGGVRFARGITRVYILSHSPDVSEAQIETYRDRISARIEFGKLKDGFLPGRLILALPDTGKSWVAGTFRAEYRVRHELG